MHALDVVSEVQLEKVQGPDSRRLQRAGLVKHYPGSS
jgi:hypothetical protein